MEQTAAATGPDDGGGGVLKNSLEVSLMQRRSFVTASIATMGLSLTRHGLAAPVAAPAIGSLGAGQVGSTLGELWIRSGLHVMFSASTLSQPRALAASLGPLASAGTPEQAVAFADVILLAVPYGAIPHLAPRLAAAMAGKILLDATNPYGGRDGAVAALAERDGAGPTTQRYFPGARVVRGFNALSMSILRREAFRPSPRLAVPLAGDDVDAVATVETLVRRAGFDPVVTGGLDTAIRFQPGHPGFERQDDAAGLRAALSGRD
ncbi:NADPH-dependent F420 reductase [Ameyamaea chiangmaiensis]|nr:NAD(P)-binding domain-containing protein [Ameyamaea chiangmaiensis]